MTNQQTILTLARVLKNSDQAINAKKYRTAITLPIEVADLLKSVSEKTGKSINSIVIDNCLIYLKDFKQEYPFSFEEKEGGHNG